MIDRLPSTRGAMIEARFGHPALNCAPADNAHLADEKLFFTRCTDSYSVGSTCIDSGLL